MTISKFWKTKIIRSRDSEVVPRRRLFMAYGRYSSGKAHHQDLEHIKIPACPVRTLSGAGLHIVMNSSCLDHRGIDNRSCRALTHPVAYAASGRGRKSRLLSSCDTFLSMMQLVVSYFCFPIEGTPGMTIRLLPADLLPEISWLRHNGRKQFIARQAPLCVLWPLLLVPTVVFASGSTRCISWD